MNVTSLQPYGRLCWHMEDGAEGEGGEVLVFENGESASI